MKAKVQTIDIDGKIWEKEGDVVFAAVGNRHSKGINVEVDFSKITMEDLTLFVSSVLILVGHVDPHVMMEAVVIAIEKLQEEGVI